MSAPIILPDDVAHGFNAALIVPAAASTLKQAQREAAQELHALADYHRAARSSEEPPELSRRQKDAVRRVSHVVTEQGINGTAFLLAVKAAVMLGGVDGGMLAQLGITLNSMITPRQTQAFNPARQLFRQIGHDPNWLSYLPEPTVRRFADLVGQFAVCCGYGSTTPPRHLPGAATRKRSWDQIMDRASEQRRRGP